MRFHYNVSMPSANGRSFSHFETPRYVRTRAEIALYDTKTSFRLVAAEIVTVDDPTVVRCVAELCRKSSPGALILPESVCEFRIVFNQCLEILGLQSDGFKPYSLLQINGERISPGKGSMEGIINSISFVESLLTSVRVLHIYSNMIKFRAFGMLLSLQITPRCAEEVI